MSAPRCVGRWMGGRGQGEPTGHGRATWRGRGGPTVGQPLAEVIVRSLRLLAVLAWSGWCVHGIGIGGRRPAVTGARDSPLSLSIHRPAWRAAAGPEGAARTRGGRCAPCTPAWSGVLAAGKLYALRAAVCGRLARRHDLRVCSADEPIGEGQASASRQDVSVAPSACVAPVAPVWDAPAYWRSPCEMHSPPPVHPRAHGSAQLAPAAARSCRGVPWFLPPPRGRLLSLPDPAAADMISYHIRRPAPAPAAALSHLQPPTGSPQPSPPGRGRRERQSTPWDMPCHRQGRSPRSCSQRPG